MIVRMLRVRLAGPRDLLDRALAVVQDLGALHVDPPRVPQRHVGDATTRRERRHAERCLADVEAARERLQLPEGPAASRVPATFDRAAVGRARRVRRQADRLALAVVRLQEERHLLGRYREFFEVFATFAGREVTWPDGQAFYVVLRREAAASVPELRRTLEQALEGEVELLDRGLASGERAVLILASARVAPRVSAMLAASRVDELPAPAGFERQPVLGTLPAINARLAALPDLLRGLERERAALAAAEGPWLRALQIVLRDRLLRAEARDRVFAADYVFVLEGWLPEARLADLEQRVRATLGDAVVVSTVGVEDWTGEAAPVALYNPPLFRPFEVLTRMLPLPKYGTIDPTPFVAVFFPAFFGLMVGDLGHGLLLAALAGLVRWRTAPGSTGRSISTVAFACAASAVVFGLLFGEFFGTLGEAMGLHPWFDRQRAMVPFLGLAVAIGAVHVLLGLLLAGLNAWRRGHRKEAVGRGVMLLMLCLTALALLAALDVLPSALFTPFVVTTLVAFTVLVAVEGLVAVIELVSTFGHVLSYARIMALGTASLMLAVVANELVGAMGSVLVGAVFALLFHLVNFAIGVFSSTVHALRLHYVEFFGAFFSPGGQAYRPLGHWQPSS